jgi:hypothetical protein
MGSKGKPSARSQRYKANQKLLQEEARSLPTTSGSDALPPPSPILAKPVTTDDAEQRAFTSVRLLLQAMVLSTRPNTNFYDMLQVVSSFFTDCEKFYHEARNQSVSCQQQLDEVNAKLLAQFEVQNAEILKLEDQLKKSQAVSDFFRAQAMKAGVVPSLRRSRSISSDDEHLTQAQLLQQLSLARTDIQVRDFALEQLQLQHSALTSAFEQVLTSSSDTLLLHVSLLEQHMQLQARLKVCSSAVQHYRNQHLEHRTTTDVQLSTCTTHLQELQAKYDKLAVQVSEEDPLLKELYDYFGGQLGGDYPTTHLDSVGEQLCKLRPYLWSDDNLKDET